LPEENLPLVSIIMPVYNTEKYLSNAVESILLQTYNNFELILVNDGSTDQSGTICDEFAKKDSRIKVIHQNNAGVSAARNTGIDNSMGKYIQFIDSDDNFEKNLLDIVVSEFESRNCDLVIFGYTNKGNHGPRRSQVTSDMCIYKKEDFLYNFYTDSNKNQLIWYCWNMMYRAAIIKKNKIYFNKDYSVGEDSLFTLNYIIKSKNISVLNKLLYNHIHFAPDERISAVGKMRPDIYEFRLSYFNILLKEMKDCISPDKLTKLYHAFYDQLIAGIIRFAAYREYFPKNEIVQRLNDLLNDDIVIIAGKGYKRKRKSDSYIVPFLMKRRYVKILYFVLHFEGKRYIKKWGKSKNVGSIYSNKNFTLQN
jgi:glycosyltransferase involved in cell wall biosynthesis